MVFNSLVFLAFLGIVLLLYYRLGFRAQNWMLIGASYLFYGWWDYRFVALLLFTTFFDYVCALWIDRETRPARRRLLLASSMTVNLGVLCIFKYFNFFAASLQSAVAVFGVHLSFPMLHVVLPVGISFYTFLSMSYTIDVYRRELKPTHDPTEFMLYVAYFPHLVAGPIVRASILLPQCQKPRVIVPEQVANGLWLMLMGYVKKVVIADRLAQAVNWGFAQGRPPFADGNSWLLLYAFAFQIYGDFSGYSDIARGLAKIMGFELVENFRAPYLVTNPASFWRHWHISLSTWLRDYLYVPLGGNRHGRLNTYRNLMTTMLLGGLWHGAGVAYVLWGLYHGALLAVHRLWHDLTGAKRGAQPVAGEAVAAERVDSREPATAAVAAASAPELALPALPAMGASFKLEEWKPTNPPPAEGRKRVGLRAAVPARLGLAGWLKQAILVVLFFHITNVGWLLFRAGSLPAGVSQLHFVLDYLRALAVWPGAVQPMAHGILVLGAVSLFLQWKFDVMNRFSEWRLVWQVIGVTAALGALAGLGIFEGSQFIYFQF